MWINIIMWFGRIISFISIIKGLLKLKDKGKYTNIIEHIKDIETPEQKEMAGLIMINKKKGKRGNLKPCPVTFRASMISSIVLCFLTVIVTCLIFVLFIWPITKKRLFDLMHEQQNSIHLVSQYGTLEKKAEYELMLKEIIEIEKNVVEARKEKNFPLSFWKRLTKKEFEDITTLLYISKQIDGIDWRGYISNICGENGWDKISVSSAGAEGLNQIMNPTFQHMNYCLGKFGTYDIKNVYHNTQAGIKYWIMCRNYLREKLNREPTIREIAIGYNCGYELAALSLKQKNSDWYLPGESKYHGNKVEFFYNNILKGNFKVWYETEIKK